MKFAKTTFIVLLIFIVKIFADEEAPNKKYEKYSPNGLYVIEMIPLEEYGTKGFGKVYECNNNKKIKLLWEIHWYAFDVYIHNDGTHLIRFGPWASDQQYHTDLAVSFYNKNILINEYLVKDLIKDPNALVYSVSHYRWTAEKSSVKNGFSDDFGKYTITMADKNVYEFDVLSGKIISNYIDKSARNSNELYQEEAIREENLANELLKKSTSFDEWKKYFNIKAREKFSTVNDEGIWIGYLYPKKQYPYKIEIMANFTISNKGVFIIDINPNELYEILEQFISLRPIKELVTSLKSHLIRIRVTSKKYNQNEFVAEDFRKLILKNGLQCCVVDKWLQVIIDFNKHDMISFLMPANSGFVILDYFNAVPIIWKNKLRSETNKEEIADLLQIDADDYSASKKYTWENCTLIMEDGSIKLLKIERHAN